MEKILGHFEHHTAIVEFGYKKGGMLVVSLRGANLEFWSHLGSSGQNEIICSREALL